MKKLENTRELYLDVPIKIRHVKSSDVDGIRKFIESYGTTEWTRFPKDDLEYHLTDLKNKNAQGLLALDENNIVALVTFTAGDFYSEYENETETSSWTGYIVEILVKPKFRNKGIGTILIGMVNEIMEEKGIKSIYAKHHEGNSASKNVLQKNGFKIIDIYPDIFRTTGTKRTALQRYQIHKIVKK